MRLSPHFDSREFSCSDGTPAPRRWLTKAQRLCIDYLEPLRAEFGAVHVVSGFRTAKRNQEVAGARSSYHLDVRGRFGVAADVRCERGTPADWYELLDGLGVPGLGRVDGGVHADNRRGRARW